MSTHFEDVWRDQMWGVWATDPRGAMFVNTPFEIPANGLGLFGMRRDAWPGFNDKFRGFGGEEFYLHEKVRKAGGGCLCLPFLRWVHRFERPDGVKYPLSLWHKVRNYVIGHTELGLPLDRIYDHFRPHLKAGWWEALTVDPSNPPEAEPAEVVARGGPGTELKAMLASLGVRSKLGCSCNSRAAEMDRLGCDGVRQKRDEVAGWLRSGAPRWRWDIKLRAGVLAAMNGLAFKLDPTDPYPGLVDEAVRRAEAKEAVAT